MSKIFKISLSLGAIFFALMAHADQPTITDLWNNTAKLHFVRAYTAKEMQDGHQENLGPGFVGGARIKVEGEAWYLFTRRVEHTIPLPDYCPNQNSALLSTEVSKSTNEGLTWSSPVRIITPVANTAWECAATDGDAIYNQTEHKWYFLFQCLSRKGWQGCYATRAGDDPMGTFESPTTEAVIPAGSLWSKVCNIKDECFQLSGGMNKIRDEGTFDIFDYKDGYYFVDFHGYDGVNGYRGLAKTSDFRIWNVLASGATLGRKDALVFNTTWDKNGPIGFGAGRIVRDKGYYYLIAEAADKNLGCTPGQNWVWGMFRTRDITASKWESLPDNPFFTLNDFPDQDPQPEPCNPAYAGFFTSQSGKVYFQVSRPSRNPRFNGIYLYELVFR